MRRCRTEALRVIIYLCGEADMQICGEERIREGKVTSFLSLWSCVKTLLNHLGDHLTKSWAASTGRIPTDLTRFPWADSTTATPSGE
jgi:hypothetical protein